jgi:hypothetical protein
MPGTNSSARSSTLQLVLVPAIITLAVTILRLVGELQHWSPRLFSPAAGGGGALVGISWLPLIFGPYFALRLASAGEGPSSTGKSIGFAFLGLLVMIGGGFVGFSVQPLVPARMLAGFAIMAVGGAVTFLGWGALSKALLVYAFAARIPVAIIMFFAISGNWGTHYDALPPGYAGPTDAFPKFLDIGALPQLVLWPAFTIVIGSIFGTIVKAIARRGKPAMQTAS